MKAHVLTALFMAAGVATLAGQRPATQQRPQQEQQQQQQRMQEMQQHMDHLMRQLQETNQRMVRERAQEQLVALGREMEGAGDRIRAMLRQMDRVHQDGTLLQDRDRAREFDRLRDRVQDMTRDLEQAHDALRKMIGPTGQADR